MISALTANSANTFQCSSRNTPLPLEARSMIQQLAKEGLSTLGLVLSSSPSKTLPKDFLNNLKMNDQAYDLCRRSCFSKYDPAEQAFCLVGCDLALSTGKL